MAPRAFADFYQWQDRQGVVHIVNDIGKVPAEYRNDVKVFKSAQPSGPAVIPAPAEQRAPESPGALYGDHTLEWWKEAFNNKNQEIDELQSSIAAKKQYIDLFEAGRRFGQIYGGSDIETYNKDVQELPEDEKRLAALHDELSDLRRKATDVGVPKYIRGE